MPDINYVDPASLNTIAGQNNPGGQFPNIGPMQGMMQGQAFNRTNEFLDLSKQNELMNQQKKQQELSEFMQNTPYRQQAAQNKMIEDSGLSLLNTKSNEMKLGRLPDEGHLQSLKTRKDIIDAVAAQGDSEKEMYTKVAPGILDTLDENGQATEATGKMWSAFAQQHDQMFPNHKIMDDPTYGSPTTEALTGMKVMHDLTVNDPKYQQQRGLQGQKIASEEKIATQATGTQKSIADAKNQVERDLAQLEWATKLQIAEMEHGLKTKLQSEAIEAQSAWQAAGHNPKGYKSLTARQKALVEPNTFSRIFPQYSMGVDQMGQAAFNKAKGGIEGTLQGIQPKEQQGNPAAAAEVLQPQGEPQGQSNEIPLENMPSNNLPLQYQKGEIRTFKQGKYKYLGGPINEPTSWQRQ